jgi:hypothetical protein
MSLTIAKPSFWYLTAALLLGITAYPSVFWLPGFVERFRYGGVGLLPSHLLFARQMGGLISVLSVVFFGLFILSAFKPALHAASHFKAWGLTLIVVYTLYALLLMACFATAG